MSYCLNMTLDDELANRLISNFQSIISKIDKNAMMKKQPKRRLKKKARGDKTRNSRRTGI